MTTALTYNGQWVTLWPYLREHYQKDFWYYIWKLVDEAGDCDKFLLDDKRGDLVDWIYFAESITTPRMWLIAQDNETQAICGFSFFTMEYQTPLGSIWVAPAYRGKQHAREIVKLSLEHAFYTVGWKMVMAVTPWLLARNLAIRGGFKLVATLPYGFKASQPLYILQIEERNHER